MAGNKSSFAPSALAALQAHVVTFPVMPPFNYLMAEKLVANAHKSVMRAAYTLENLPEQSLSDDLYRLAEELRRIQEDMLRGARRVHRT